MTGATASHVLDRTLGEGPGPRPLTVAMIPNSNPGRWRIRPTGVGNNSTSSDPATPWKVRY